VSDKPKTAEFVFSLCYIHKCPKKYARDVAKQGHGKHWSTSATIRAINEHEARRALVYSMLDNGYWVVSIENAGMGAA